MKKYLLLAVLSTIAIAWPIAQQATITAYPQAGGVTCYGAGAALSCVYIPIVVTTGTELPPRPTTPPVLSTPTPIAPASATPTIVKPNTPTLVKPDTPTMVKPATATPSPVPPLLLNGDFEKAWSGTWTRFDLWPELPNYNDERGDPRSRHSGAQSLRIYNEYRCWLAGVYQTVPVRQFSTYKFSVWARTWAAQGFNFDLPPDLSVSDGVAVGIDNSGGVDPTSTGIAWVEVGNTENWRQVSVQTVSLSNRITVFIRVRLGVSGPNQCQWPLPVLMGFIDDASLVIAP